MSIFKLNILIIFLFYIINVSFSIAEDDEDPFIDFEKDPHLHNFSFLLI